MIPASTSLCTRIAPKHGLNDKDAALAAGYSLTVAKNTSNESGSRECAPVATAGSQRRDEDYAGVQMSEGGQAGSRETATDLW
jgi:hypothetical protein